MYTFGSTFHQRDLNLCLPLYFYAKVFVKFEENTNKEFNCVMIRSSHWRCSVKLPVLPEACNFIKKGTLPVGRPGHLLNVLCTFNLRPVSTGLAQVFSCEFCEIFKNTFFTEHLRTSASEQCYDAHNQTK